MMNTLSPTFGPPLPTILVGQKLVAIQQQLGIGGFGVVHKVNEVGTSIEYALKDVVCENESDISAAENEILTLRNISHPNVISIIESGDYEDTEGLRHMLILTEYCRGGNLNDRLRRASSNEVVCKWIRQMAEVLHFLHSRNLVHRDLKPENVLLTENDDIKIGDFGLAREFISVKEIHIVQGTVTTYVTYARNYMNTYAGTRHWMAPEVFPGPEGHGHYSEKADVFSLGILFLAILERDFIIDHKGKRYYGVFWNEPGEGKVGVGYAMCKRGPVVAATLQARGCNTLQMIALDALKFEPKDRPSAAMILNRITTFISQNQPFLSIPNSVCTGNLGAQYQELGGGLGTRYPGLVGLRSTNPGVGFGLRYRYTNPGAGFGLRSTDPGVGFGLRSTNPGAGFGLRSTNPGVGFGFRSTNPGVGFGLRSINPGAGFGLRSINPGAGFGLRPSNPGVGFGFRSTNPGVGFGLSSTNPGVG